MSGSDSITFTKQYKQNAQVVSIPLIEAWGSLLTFPSTVSQMEQSQPRSTNFVSVQGLFYNRNITSKTQTYVSNFLTKYHANSALGWDGGGYDAVYMYAEAVKAAGNLTTNSVVAQLETITYVGVLGTRFHRVMISHSAGLLPVPRNPMVVREGCDRVSKQIRCGKLHAT